MVKNQIDFITLGCSKNLVDTEQLMGLARRHGFSCTHDSKRPIGEIAIINTCGFIGDAKEESINTILEFAERKKQGKLRKLFVMGCLSQRYLATLPDLIPEVDGWFGARDLAPVIKALGCRPDPASAHRRIRTDGLAFSKVLCAALEQSVMRLFFVATA